ncbi:beta strand repeat-containing protein [Cellulophaga baltica]|uniref:beta strand repeat-containing protein n=1 Tax=Cellulophaga baltica TaxID=76594 RepID=UPI00249488DD|nr:hypothetical protein [Cellulophaga baltica]
MKVLSPLVLFLSLVLSSYGQVKIGDHINSIDSNSILELESNSKVLVVTRITNAEMNAITPINGALAYNTDEDCLYQYRNNIWTSLCIDITGGQTITSLTDNNDGSFTYSDENGIDARIEKANLIDNSDGTYTFSNSTTTLLINTAANSNSYNNNISGITASNVQEAIDFIKKETDSAIVALQNDINTNTTNFTTLLDDKENTANKSTDGTLVDNSDVDFPTEQAVKTYVDAQVGAVSQDDDITDATLNASSILAIQEGTTEVTVDLSALEESDDITANTTAIANEVTRATAAETANATAITALGTDKENTANKSTDGTLADNSDVDFPTEQAVKTYVDAQVGAVSQDDDITDATLNTSSVLAIQEGTTEVTVDLSALEESDDITANTTAIANEVTRATAAETANTTAISNEVTRATNAETTNATAITALGTDKENTANKSTDGTLVDNSDVDFPTEQAVKTYVDAQVGAVSQDDDITDATLNASSVLAIQEGTTEVTVDLSALEESDDITANTTAIANEVTRATTAETANATAISNEVTRATDAETANANNISSNDTEIAANITAIASLGTDKENTANKSTDGTLADNSDVDFPTEQAVKTYVDAQVGAVSQDDDITDATLNASSILAIQEGTTEVTVDLSALEESDDISSNTTAIANEVTRATAAETANTTAISNEVTRATNAETANTTAIANEVTRATDAETANATAITALGTDKENTANKSTDGTLVDNSDVDFPTEQAVKTYVDAQVGAVSQDDDITDATLNASSILAIKEGSTEVTVDLSALEESDDITANTTAINNEVTRATDAETANANNISSNDTEIAANITAIASLGTDKENTANKSTDGTLVDNSDVDFPTEQAVKTYVDAQVGAVSQDDDITDATLNASSILAIKEGTTEVTVDLSALEESADITANTTAISNEVTRATDAETANANNISSNDTEIAANITAITALGTDKENTANKSTDGTLADNSDVDFPTEQAVKTYVDAQVGAVSQDDDITDATLSASSILAIKEGTTEVTVNLSVLEESDDITANTIAIANEVTRATAAETANTTAIANEVTRATNAETANANNISSNDTEIAANISAIASLGTDKENTANKSTDGTLADNSDVDFPTEQAVKTYVDAQVGAVSQDDDITDATLNASSILAIKEGTTEVTVDLSALEESADITANTTAISNEVTRATDAETANANNISSNDTEIAANITAITALGTDKENTANKSTDGTLADNSDVNFPTEQAVKTYVDAQVSAVSQDDDITDATLNASNILAIKEGTTEVTVDLSALEESDDITANTTAIANEVTRATAAETANATAISNEVTRATNAETVNANNISSNDTEIAANTTAIASLVTDKENTANKSTDGTLVDNSDVDFPTEQAVKTYVDAQVGAVSQDDDITDATLNASSVLAIKEGTTEVTVDLSALEESNDITANTTAIANEVTRATAAETANATAISNEVTRATTAETVNATAITALGTDKENTANKSTDGTLADNSDVDFPTEQAVKTYVDAQVGAVSQDDDITDATLNASSVLAIKEGTTEVTVDLSALEESDDITENTTAIANEVTRATAAETTNATAISNEVTRATNAETTNANNISSNDTEIAANITAIANEVTRATNAETTNATAITALGTDKENTANKSTDGTLADNSDVDFPTEQAVKTYVDAQVGGISGNGDISSTDLVVGGDTNALLGDVTLEIKANAVTTAKINPGSNNQTLITNGTGAVTWVDSSTLQHTGTEGSLFFAGSDGSPTENNGQVFFDASNNRFGIGTNTPDNKLQVTGAIRSQGFLNSDGNANEPAFRFSGDTNTGMYRRAADEIGFSVGGNDAIIIDEPSTGNTHVIITQSLELEGTLTDTSNSAGTAGQVLTSTATGTAWIDPALVNAEANSSPIKAIGKIAADGSILKATTGVIITKNLNTGHYTVTLPVGATTDANYIIQLSQPGRAGEGNDDPGISYSNQTTTSFDVIIGDNDNGGGERIRFDSEFMFTILDF